MQKITPFLWFNNQAAKAAKFYVSIFKKNSRVMSASPMSAEFKLNGLEFIALNGGPLFKFTEAVSFFVTCKTQKEVDYFWKKLSAGGKIQQCGWLKDKFGLSWQIIPEILGTYLGDRDRTRADRVVQAMLKMKKIDIAKLTAAYQGPKVRTAKTSGRRASKRRNRR